MIATVRALDPVLPGSSVTLDVGPGNGIGVADIIFDTDSCSFCVLSGRFDACQPRGCQEDGEGDAEFDS